MPHSVMAAQAAILGVGKPEIASGGAAFPSHLPFLDTLQGRRYNGGLEPF
ncbi:MAG: hypothetical protein J0H36_07630 [Hyphomicrobium denitrificans]|nr:hypothetical protein [Hyphomicrobium denitrificans]